MSYMKTSRNINNSKHIFSSSIVLAILGKKFYSSYKTDIYTRMKLYLINNNTLIKIKM